MMKRSSNKSRSGSQHGRAPEDRPYLSPGEIARELGLHSSTVRRMFENIEGVVRFDNGNRPEGKRPYGVIRIPRSVYRQYLKDRTKAPSARPTVDQHIPTTVGGPSPLSGLSEDLADRCHQPIEGSEKASGGRPKALLAVYGEKIRSLRGDASQEVFSGLRDMSADVLQKAERGRATQQTLIKICAHAPKNRQNLTPEDLKIK